MAFETLKEAIDAVNPEVLESLRHQHPDYTKYLTSGKRLGDSFAASDADARSMLRDLAVASIPVLREKFDELLHAIRTQSMKSVRMRNWGASLTILGGIISAWLVLVLSSKELVAAITATVAASGGLCTLASMRLSQTKSGISLATPEEHSKVISMRLEVERFAFKLGRLTNSEDHSQEVREILDRLETLAVELLRYSLSSTDHSNRAAS